MVLDTARRIAEEVLFPAATAVDAADRVPADHLDLLAANGFYGLAAPADAGGLGLADRATASRVIEILASGCLTTTFVWLQHHSAVAAVADSPLRKEWLPPLARGDRRAGVVLAGLRPGPPSVRAEPVDGGYLIDGQAPWVTGWVWSTCCTRRPGPRTARWYGRCSTRDRCRRRAAPRGARRDQERARRGDAADDAGGSGRGVSFRDAGRYRARGQGDERAPRPGCPEPPRPQPGGGAPAAAYGLQQADGDVLGAGS